MYKSKEKDVRNKNQIKNKGDVALETSRKIWAEIVCV